MLLPCLMLGTIVVGIASLAFPVSRVPENSSLTTHEEHPYSRR